MRPARLSWWARPSITANGRKCCHRRFIRIAVGQGDTCLPNIDGFVNYCIGFYVPEAYTGTL
ncbi:hypothetical protein DESC_940087 [Desulfosarcina cetonica]|nr:hypothetical protein DESC_940087 [Desulfosarcina cetonica]